ncbi:precolibactin export MATE transporter ClbM [Gilliamella sp. App4-10]|uniref:precolibactin export MATE transporter ClbM n=1 Tax=Gilliamella sp. App4-10 TaxID=3120231 RepID=UPI00080E3F32|nr:precolibactin export MATE transporter ClbM [Gilliamella apicola]OCG21786.1 MATE family efflux transporter [Gilliamella apicola]
MFSDKVEPDENHSATSNYSISGMYDGSLYTLIIRLALPMFIGMLTQVTYTVADIFWLSHIDTGSGAIIAGVGLIFPIGMVLYAIANGIQIGIGSLLSRATGMRHFERAQQILSVGMTIVVFFTVVLGAFAYLFAEPLLRGLGANDMIFLYAADFYYYSLPTVFSILFGGAMMGLFQGAGKTLIIMKASLLGAIINIILDPIMIFIFDFGVKGVALASFIAQIIVVSYFVLSLPSLQAGFKYKFCFRHLSWLTYKQILSVGLAQMLMQIIISVGIIIYNFFIVRLDVNAMAAFTLTGRIDYFIMTPMLAIAAALLTIVGQNWGRGKIERTLKAYRVSMILAFSVVLALSIIHIILAPYVYPLFTQSEETCHYAILQIRIMELALPFIAISLLASEYYQAIGKSWYSVFITLIRHVFISVPAVYLLTFSLDMGIIGVYFGAMSGTFISALLAFWLLRMSPRLVAWNEQCLNAQQLSKEVS